MSIERAQETIRKEKANLELARSLERLRNNKDFQRIIMQGYLKDHMASQIQASVSEGFDSEARKDLVASAQATAYLIEYFQTIERFASQSERTIFENEQLILELQQFNQGA